MKAKTYGISAFLILLLLLIILILDAQRAAGEALAAPLGYSSDTVPALVIEQVEQGSVELGSITQPYQIVKVRVLEGRYANETLQIDHGKRQIRPDGFTLEPGDRVMVSVGVSPQGKLEAYFVDYVRWPALLMLAGFFILGSLLISGWKGLRSVLSIGISLLVILYFIIPRILSGSDPILISLVGAMLFLALTQYLIYGWTLKTQVALAGMAISVLITGLLSIWFVQAAHLSGFGDENAMYLMQLSGNIDIRNLLIAGIIIGTLGVLDDLVIGQASAVIELHLANPQLSFRQRFTSAMNIGRDHVAATVNTLVLAYLGASMSMFLLFSLHQINFGRLVNLDYIAEEIVRSLVGTLGLFSAVPITTLLACLVVDSPERIRRLSLIFGPLTDGRRHID